MNTSAPPPFHRPKRRAGALALRAALAALALGGAVSASAADAIDTLRAFTRDVKGGRAAFTQTVTSPDGARKRVSNGTFEFARPNRFRFAYLKPSTQQIVADGQTVWLHDPDLAQVQKRPLAQALGATPAALLAGGDVERDFVLKALPSADGVDWVQATPRDRAGADGMPQVKSVDVGFRAGVLAELRIVDAFGQRSVLQFSEVETQRVPPASSFRFEVPKGTDVIGG